MLNFISPVASVSRWCVIVLATFAVGAAAAQVSVVGGSLASLEGTETLVTVVIRDTGAVEPNCRVVEVGPDYFAVRSANGDRNAYLYSAVKEVRVQEGAIASEMFKLSQDRGLSEDEQAVFEQAIRTAGDIYDRAISNQAIRMRAAALLALNGDDAAKDYLIQRTQGNDILLALSAYLMLNLVERVPVEPELIRTGLSSGSPQIRAITMTIIGMLELTGYEDQLMASLDQRLAQASAPAAFALGKLQYEPAVPQLLDMILGLNQVKSESALEALVQIGGVEVIDGLKQRLPNASGLSRYRLIEGLVRLDDPLGVRLMKDEALQTPTLADRAAIILAARGDLDAKAMLEDRLTDRYEPTLVQLVERANIAIVLLKGGDLRRVSVIQELLNSPDALTQLAGIAAASEARVRSTLTLLTAPMASPDNLIALSACEAAVAIANADYARRLYDMTKYATGIFS